jgi:hypothetical protein
MTKAEFLQEMRKLADDGGWGTQSFFEADFEGSCPCFFGGAEVDGKTLNVVGRCWRVSDNIQDLHVWGDFTKKDLQEMAKAVKRSLDKQKWYNKYTIIYKNLSRRNDGNKT